VNHNRQDVLISFRRRWRISTALRWDQTLAVYSSGRELLTVVLKWWFNDRSATWETYAVGGGLQTISATWIQRVERWCRLLYTWRICCTRIRRRNRLRSWCSCGWDGPRWPAGHCHGRTWWTSGCCGGWKHHNRRYPSTRTHEGCSWSVPTPLGTNCTRRSTSGSWHDVSAGQISACSGLSMSADEVVHCWASSCPRVVESNFKLLPRTVEEGSITADILLD